MKLLLLLSVLTRVRALPTVIQAGDLTSFFDDKSMPIISGPVTPFLNLTSQVTSMPHPRDGNLEKRLVQLNYKQCTATIDGRNQGNPVAFVWTGVITITQRLLATGTRNGVNPVEVIVDIMSRSNSAGSLRYVTNQYLARNLGGPVAGSIDFAFVSSTATSVTVTPDSSIATSNFWSTFQLISGLTTPPYLVTGGTIQINIVNNLCAGSINLIGRNLQNGLLAPYRAVMLGTVTTGTALF